MKAMDDSKIIIVGADLKWEEEQLLKTYDNSEFILLADLLLKIGKKTEFLSGGVDVFESFDGSEKFVIRRSRGEFEKLVAFVEVLGKRGFCHSDSFKSVSTNLNKEIFLSTIESDIFPHPEKSFFLKVGDEVKNVELEFPLISKPVTGRHGEGIVIHEDFESLKNEVSGAKENLLIQKYLDIESEYRIFVVGDVALGCVEKKAAPGKQIANYAAGASFTAVEMPRIFLDEAVKLCKSQEIDIGGVDIVKTKKGEYYILEINRCPEFRAFSEATGINVAEKIINFIKSK